MKKVITRFAPSPTGHVHIGNIRVAIFNWLFARHHGGAFKLRIEDTDRERSTEEAVQKVLDALAWLQLDVDHEPIYQSTRKKAHLEMAEMLLKQGKAYETDFGQPEKGTCIVFKMPSHDSSYTDLVKGTITKKATDMKDLVIVRSDGNPVFHLANVLDDAEMGITHVIRGDDHVENTFRHIALYQAIDAPIPEFAHLPMIVNAQGKPYSKRDGDAYVGDFMLQGFLPDALLNYLTLLGWSPGDDQEVLSHKELISSFSLERVQSSPAKMDLKKLRWMNGEYIKKMPPDEFLSLAQKKLPEYAPHPSFDKVISLMQERVQTLDDLPNQTTFFFNDDYPLDQKAFRKRVEKDTIPELLHATATAFQFTEHFDPETIERLIQQIATRFDVGLGTINPAIRLTVTGQAGGPDLVQVLALLGKETVIARLHKIVKRD